MSSCCRVSLVSLVLLVCFLQVFIEGEVLWQTPSAQSMFLRSKRANMFLVEEILQGNLERECYEETCNYEEAREYFEDDDKTKNFWMVYYDEDQCQPNPCLHRGNCTDQVGGFVCSCVPPYHGATCELRAPEEPQNRSRPLKMSECPTEGPTACHQLCTVSYHSFSCSCMSGFKLHSNKRSCVPEVKFPCGRFPGRLNTTTLPWQVSLLDSRGVELCGGVVLGRRSILTASRCLLGSDQQPSNFYVLAGNKKLIVPVRALYFHNRFHKDYHDNNLVLLELANPLPFGPTLVHLCLPTKDFSENILMHAGRTGIVQRHNQDQNLVYMTLDECRSQLNVSHPLSNKMFCVRRQNGAEGRQSGAQTSPNGSAGNKSEAQGRRHGPLWNQHGDHERLNRHMLSQNQNQPHKSQNESHGMPNGAENRHSSKIESHKFSESDSTLRSEVRGCGGLLPGTPIATVERGTAFLTGLLISTSAGCHGDSGGGMVFTKLSRYLVWIKMRLQVAEDHMTPQVNLYPENR
ncbi:hypothetical protein PAMP_016742 [Pampus punctatissimus]